MVNLRPLDMTHTFKDRVRETGELCTHLGQENVRLISIVGRGGMGKTALVSRVLADLERGVLPTSGQGTELVVDGILYLSARSTGLSLERIYADVGRMLGEPVAGKLAARWASGEIPLVAKVEYLLETMQDGLYLILLDNLEDRLAPDGTIADEGLRLFVERCLTQPGGARLIATSREHVQVVPAALRNARSIPLREGLPENEAIALLRELDPQTELGLRDALEDDLRQAVQLTGGIPRALEIIAGILQADPTASLSHLLADRDLFGGQVVESLVAASHRRLGENERRVIEALAIFNCPAEETAIAYLLHPWYPGLDVRFCLRHLVSGYFVSANRVTGEYSLHPLDREYAYRHLLGEVDTEIENPPSYTRRNMELRVADFYASIRKPESEWKTIGDLAPQLAEFEHHVRAEDYGGACRVLEPIGNSYLYLWGHYARLVEMREHLTGKLTEPALQAENLSDLGNAWRALGQFEQSLKIYEQALSLVRELGNHVAEGQLLGNMGSACRSLGQFDCGLTFCKESLAIARKVGDRKGEGIQLGRLGRTYRTLRQFDQAIELYEKSLAIAREVGNRQWEGYNLGSLGNAYLGLGQIERAIEFYEQSLAIARAINERREEGTRLGSLSKTYRALGQIEQAVRLCEEAVRIARETGDRAAEERGLGNLGNYYRDLGHAERSIPVHQEALSIARQIGYRVGEAYCLVELGETQLAMGELNQAHKYCVRALGLDMAETGFRAALILGMVLLQQHDSSAGSTFEDVISRCQVLLGKASNLYELRYARATALVGQSVCNPRWVDASHRAELLAPALEEYRRALEITSAAGVVGDALRDLELIRKAGIEGLEPIFDLLQGALPKTSG
ncbi:MAG: tetratricopeptide repeat protein [Thermoflexales bacterium]|nr:tetratricopeptide repeat protein [Thermoflexales bacterium]